MAEEQGLAQLVVIGSSAGGDTLSILVGTLAPNFPAPVMIAQHLDPNRSSHPGETLAADVGIAPSQGAREGDEDGLPASATPLTRAARGESFRLSFACESQAGTCRSFEVNGGRCAAAVSAAACS